MTPPFDITKPYSLRNGRKCEVHKLDEPVATGECYVGSFDGGNGILYIGSWNAEGCYDRSATSEFDLVNTPPKPRAQKRWINWYAYSGGVTMAEHASAESAAERTVASAFFLGTTEHYAPGPGTRTIWLNVSPSGRVDGWYDTKELADSSSAPRIACVPVIIPTEGE